jgi:hypothetical protein
MTQTERMGAWGTGVFENDGALDFLAELRDTAPAERAAFVRERLGEAADEDDYLEVDSGQHAVAAAAVVAAVRSGTGQASVDTGIPTAELPPADPDLVSLALRALDRVAADDSEWHELWAEGDLYADAMATLAVLRTALA